MTILKNYVVMLTYKINNLPYFYKLTFFSFYRNAVLLYSLQTEKCMLTLIHGLISNPLRLAISATSASLLPTPVLLFV